jgi:hypothetical protein
MRVLCRNARRCKQAAAWKDGPVDIYLKRVGKSQTLRNDLLTGKYKMQRTVEVEVFRPKHRIANAPASRDKIWQKSMCECGIYEDLTSSLIVDNIACQKGKGTDMAIRRVIRMLQRLHREAPGEPVFGVHLDIKRYFPSTPQNEVKELDRWKITEELLLLYLDEIIESYEDKRPKEDIEKDPFGKRGTGLGSEINQLHEVSLLDPLDHELKTFCRNYIRYNDDFLILDHDIEVVKRARDTIKTYLAGKGLTMTDKGGIFKASDGFYFLRKRFIMKTSGKIIIRLHKKALAEERKTLRGLKRGVDQGVRTMDDVKHHYQSWIANAEYAGDAPIRAMDHFYTITFRQKPEYKRKRRYLYGRNRQRRQTENQRAGA